MGNQRFLVTVKTPDGVTVVNKVMVDAPSEKRARAGGITAALEFMRVPNTERGEWSRAVCVSVEEHDA